MKRFFPFIFFLSVIFVAYPTISYAQRLDFIDRLSLEVYCFFSDCHSGGLIYTGLTIAHNTQEDAGGDTTQKEDGAVRGGDAVGYTMTDTPTVIREVRNHYITQDAPTGTSFRYDAASVREDNGFLECKGDGDVLQWQRHTYQWECVAPAMAVFDDIDKGVVDVRSDGALRCRNDGDALVWDGFAKRWTCGTVVSGSTTNQNLTSAILAGTTLTISIENGTSVSVDLASLDTDTDTHLSEAEVDAFVANNGFLTAEVDGDPTNELITSANLVGSTLNITDAGGTTSVSLASLLDNTDTLDSLACSSGEVAQWNGAAWVCAAAAVDTDDQFVDTLSLTGATLNLSLDGDGVAPSTVDLSALINDADASTTNEIITASSYTPATNILSITEAGTTHNFDLSELDNAGLVALADIDTEAELESILTDVTNVFTNNDTIDISDNTNLAGDAEVILTGDSLSLAASIARDSELHDALTLAGALDYLTLSGQVLTLGTIDISDDTNLAGGNGLTLTGDSIAINAPTCAGTDKLQWNGTAFVCSADVDTDTDTTYSAGSGLALSVGNVFSLSAGIDDLTDVDTSTIAPSSGDLLTWDGTNWVTTSPTNYTNNIYTADGTLTGDRIVSLNTNTLSFDGGNIGLGTTNPLAQLDIRGDTGGAALVRIVNSANRGMTIRPNSSGNGAGGGTFGLIGPAADFKFAGHVRPTSYLSYDLGSAGSTWRTVYTRTIKGRSNPSQGDLNVRSGHSNAPLTFGIDTTEYMRIANTGNVGIGTTTPTDSLHIAGDMRLTGAFKDANNQPGTAGQILSSTVTGTDWIDAPTSATGSIDTHSDVDTSTITPSSGDLLTWDGTNWVTTSPTNYTNNIYTADGTLTGARTVALGGNNLYFTGTGNVGIGTTAPSHKLHVNGNVGAIRFYGTNGTAGSPTFTFDGDADTGMFRGTTNELAFTTAGSEKMRIDNNGNVGIGTTNPYRKLDVRGNGYFTKDLTVEDSEIIYTQHTYKDEALGELSWNLLQTQKTNNPNDKDFATITSGTGWKQATPITRWKIGDEGSNGRHYGYVGYFPLDGYNDKAFRINTGIEGSTNLVLGTNYKDVITIDKNQYVGIGTSLPTRLLHIAGNMRLERALYDGNNQPGTAGQILSSTATGTDWIDADTVGTDNQDLTLTGNTLAISNDPNTDVDLSPYLDNTDNQIVDVLSLVGNVMHLSLANDGVADNTLDLSSIDTDTTYDAGNGLNLSGTTFAINAPTCAGTDKLQWNGTAFVCSADVDTDTDTTYSAGSGLDLTGTVFAIANNGITATHLNTSVAGNGLTGGGGTALAVGAGNGIVVNANDVSIDVTTTGTTATTSSNSGLEVTADGLSLLRGCADGETLKWNASTSVWECGADRATYNSTTTADYTNNSTTLTDVPGMSFPIGANEDWYFEMSMHINADSQDDSRIRVTCPVGATGDIMGINHYAGDNRANVDCNTISAKISTANNDAPYTVQGLVQNGATAGTVQLQMREHQANDAANGITVYAGSVLQAWKISGADLAEIYYTDDDGVVEGTIVRGDATRHAGVQRATQETAAQMLGVISTEPGHVIGNAEGTQDGHPVPLALSGRIPVRVSTENGPIASGDRITISSVPGVGMRATDAGYTIGTAITGYDGEGEGTVLAFVENQWFPGIHMENDIAQENNEVQSGLSDAVETDANDTETFMQKLTTGFTGVLTWTQDVFTVVIDAIFEAPVAFLDRVTFMDRVLFADPDIAGTATVIRGEDHVDVRFDVPYTFTPVVTVTPQDAFVSFAISDVTVEGFTINIADDFDADVTFHWIAIAVTDDERRHTEHRDEDQETTVQGDENTQEEIIDDADGERSDELIVPTEDTQNNTTEHQDDQDASTNAGSAPVEEGDVEDVVSQSNIQEVDTTTDTHADIETDAPTDDGVVHDQSTPEQEPADETHSATI